MKNDYRRHLRARFSSSSSSSRSSYSYSSYSSYSSLSLNRYYGGYGRYILIFNYYYNDYEDSWVNDTSSGNSTTAEVTTLQIIAYVTSSIISTIFFLFFSCYCFVRVHRDSGYDSDEEVVTVNQTKVVQET